MCHQHTFTHSFVYIKMYWQDQKLNCKYEKSPHEVECKRQHTSAQISKNGCIKTQNCELLNMLNATKEFCKNNK